MNKPYFPIKLCFGAVILLATSLVHARIPVWSYTPLTPTTITLSAHDTTTVQYTLTNQSTKQHSLVMRSIPGITQVSSPGNCQNPTVLRGHQSCILNLTINGGALANDVIGGPILCEQGNPNQCYQPSLENSLKITRKSADCYTVRGSVNGLTGTLILANNGGDPQTINSDGSFTFFTALPPGSPYSVTVQSQPTTQTCTVNNGTVTITNADVTNVMVQCSTNSYTVGGTVSGLASSESIVLINNGGDNLTRGVNGAFTFPNEVAQGATYNVTVFTQPSTQTCSVTNGTGTMGGANVTNVGVNCTYFPTSFTSSLPSGSDLALSVSGITEYGVPGTPPSGVSRVITITNSGSYDAVDFSVTYTGLPPGTTHTGSTCDNFTTLTQGSSCTIQINPGNSSTSSDSSSYISCSNGSEYQ